MGLPYECAACAACGDVCDGVMEKWGRRRDLVHYATHNRMALGWRGRGAGEDCFSRRCG